MNHPHAFKALLAFGLSTSLVTLLAQEPAAPAVHAAAAAAPAADTKPAVTPAPKAVAKAAPKAAVKKADAKKADAKKADAPKADAATVEAAKADAVKADAVKADAARAEGTKDTDSATVELEPAGTFALAPGADALPSQGFTYKAEGRRDPFVTLLKRGSETKETTKAARAAGLAGLSTGEVTLRGILASEGQFVAMLLGADDRTYIVRTGDKLADGTIDRISADAMVIEQMVASNGPAQPKSREVRKTLRRTDGTN